MKSKISTLSKAWGFGFLRGHSQKYNITKNLVEDGSVVFYQGIKHSWQDLNYKFCELFERRRDVLILESHGFRTQS